MRPGRADFPVISSTNETRLEVAELEPSELDEDFRDFTKTGCRGKLWLDSRLVGPASRFGAKVTRDVLRLDASESIPLQLQLLTEDVILNLLGRLTPVVSDVTDEMLKRAGLGSDSIETRSVNLRFGGSGSPASASREDKLNLDTRRLCLLINKKESFCVG